jgi:hypothetical protein
MRLAREPQHAGHRNVGMPDPFAEKIRRLDRGTLLLQRIERAGDLSFAAIDPKLELFPAERAFIDKAYRLVAEPGRQRTEPELMSPLHAPRWQHRPLGASGLIEPIENHGRIDQGGSVVEHQRRDPPQRIIWRDQLGVAEGRPRLVLEVEAVEPQRNGHATDERRIILADEDHGEEPVASNLIVNHALDRGNRVFIALVHRPLLDALGPHQLGRDQDAHVFA